MAKASQADLDMAADLCAAFSTLTDRWCPAMPEAIATPREGMELEHFDADNDAQCARALQHLLAISERGSLFRVVMGMSVLLDPRNKLVDPNSDVIEHHPDRKDSARFRWLTEDHADPKTRAIRREILERLPLLGHGAAAQLIDDAMAAPPDAAGQAPEASHG